MRNARKRKVRVALLPTDPYESARIAGLRYVSDTMPGIVRRRAGTGFTYRMPDGSAVRDTEVLRRIRSLVIPPAWRSVWICPLATGHMQAVGFDEKGRKQYRYHPLYRQVRDATKFTRMAVFGLALPAIRNRVAADLKVEGLPKNKVVATVVRLLETTCIRVGNEEYRKQNDSFGLTTLRNRHVQIEGRILRFHFKGKSGQTHDVELTDRKLARIVSDCQELPGFELFQYVDSDGQPCRITSEDVNQYLKEISGEDFTAKDFRTWRGSCEAALALEAMGPASSESEAKKNIVAAVKLTAGRLGNRPATCRKYYVHPAVVDAYTDGSLFATLENTAPVEGLRREEAAFLAMIATHAPKPKLAATEDKDLESALKKSVGKAPVAEIVVAELVASG